MKIVFGKSETKPNSGTKSKANLLVSDSYVTIVIVNEINDHYIALNNNAAPYWTRDIENAHLFIDVDSANYFLSNNPDIADIGLICKNTVYEEVYEYGE